MRFKRLLKIGVYTLAYLPIAVILFGLAILSRFVVRKMDVGIGPEPLINNVNHCHAMNKFGWKAETFVTHTYFITQNFNFSSARWGIPLVAASYIMFVRSIFRYKILYFYFNGGALAWTPHRSIEGLLYRVSGIRTVVMPYGGDVHNLTYSKNLIFKHAMMLDYPKFQTETRAKIIRQVDYWTRWADHVVGGCDWVDYMWHWDTLVSAHFSAETASLVPRKRTNTQTIRILHAPNHRNIKGTSFVIAAVEKLKAEGYQAELVLAEKKSNDEILSLIHASDIVVDQLIIGWYGMFGVEAMACARPVVCHIRDDLEDLFKFAGVTSPDGPPVVKANHKDLYEKIKLLCDSEKLRLELGDRGRKYVEAWHSTEAIGKTFNRINEKLIGSRKD
jgi:hypothetical protein